MLLSDMQNASPSLPFCSVNDDTVVGPSYNSSSKKSAADAGASGRPTIRQNSIDFALLCFVLFCRSVLPSVVRRASCAHVQGCSPICRTPSRRFFAVSMGDDTVIGPSSGPSSKKKAAADANASGRPTISRSGTAGTSTHSRMGFFMRDPDQLKLTRPPGTEHFTSIDEILPSKVRCVCLYNLSWRIIRDCACMVFGVVVH